MLEILLPFYYCLNENDSLDINNTITVFIIVCKMFGVQPLLSRNFGCLRLPFGCIRLYSSLFVCVICPIIALFLVSGVPGRVSEIFGCFRVYSIEFEKI